METRVASADGCGGFRVRTSSTMAGFENAWPRLEDPFASCGVDTYPFQCREHLEVWLDTIGARTGTIPLFVEVTADESPVLLLPFGIRNSHGIRLLTFLDCGVSDYNAPVVYERAQTLTEHDVHRLWTAILGMAPPCDLAVLQKVPQTVGSYRNPMRVLAPANWHHSGHTINLGNVNDRAEIQPKRDIQDSKRSRKRLSEFGPLTFSIASTGTEVERVLAIFLEQKSRRYQATLGRAGFDVPGQTAYYAELAKRCGGKGVQLAYLSLGEQVIATALNLISGRRLYYMMCAYDDGKYRKYSPGRLLLEDLIDWSLRNDIDVFDFGIGDESYKLRWRQEDRSLGHGVYPVTATGHAFHMAQNAKAALKRILPEPIRSTVKRLFRGGTSAQS
jgi:CelD/BcsL family acetyltransferase involved in cellulose biosynthesis